MYVILAVTSWQDQRDSSYRVAPSDPLQGTSHHRHMLFNTSHMSEIKAHNTTGAIFKYFDNPLDRREGPSTVKVTNSVASIIAAADTTFESNMITLAIHKNNNPDNATTDHTIPVESLSWADRYNPDQDNHCWVIFYNGAFKRREVLCNLSIEQLENIADTGTTSTSDLFVP